MKKVNSKSSVYFTQHAFIRVKERISLDVKEISQIIKWEKFISIGMEKGTHREHRLFYSNLDSQCFVIIQDVKTNTVITILPLDYHELIGWAVSLESQEEAKELILGKEKPNINQNEIITMHRFFHISCDVLDGWCKYVRSTKLGKFEASDYDHKIEKFLMSNVVINDILEEVYLITKDNNYHVDEIIIKRRSKDIAPTFVELSTLKITKEKSLHLSSGK